MPFHLLSAGPFLGGPYSCIGEYKRVDIHTTELIFTSLAPVALV